MKKGFVLFTIFLSFFVIHYLTHVGWNSYRKANFDYLINELDFTRLYHKKKLNENELINLKLSSNDLKVLDNDIRSFLNSGLSFIPDNKKIWRRGKILVDNEWQQIKYKFHGTSLTPMKNNGFSLRIKHIKNEKLIDFRKEFNLITSRDNPTINTLSINNYAKKYGVIAPGGRLVILKINGRKSGLYTIQDNLSKEMLEREYGITNYAIIKTNDDWDNKSRSHSDDTDLFYQSQTIKGPNLNNDIALGAFKLLSQGILSQNISLVKNLIDLEYTAKFFALMYLHNSNHQITGDNLKYLYDYTSGKFKFYFRLEEGYIIENLKTVNEFNSFPFQKYNSAEVEKLFNILIKDKEFRLLRDKALLNIINNKDILFNEIERNYQINQNVIYNSNVSIRSLKSEKSQYLNSLKVNLSRIIEYLQYSKIYVSVEKIDKNQKITIINDSYSSLTLEKIKFKSASKDSTYIKLYDYIIPEPELSSELHLVHDEYSINIDNVDNIESLIFSKNLDNKKVDSKHIYLNKVKTLEYYDYYKSLQTFTDNSIIFNVSSDSLNIQKGSYSIVKNIIAPFNLNIIIEKGTKLKIGNDISVLIRGGLKVKGTKEEPVVIGKLNNNHFGVFAINPNNPKQTVDLNYLRISGGNESNINGIEFTGQLSIHNSDVKINNSLIENSISDDGINIKNSKVIIKNSIFRNNFGDQVDLDNCEGSIKNNIFSFSENINSINNNRDGVDLSRSNIIVEQNSFNNFSDKAISIGEITEAKIYNNTFSNSNIGIAVKDESIVIAFNNKFDNNIYDYSLFNKKSFYSLPKLFLSNKPKDSQVSISEGIIFVNNKELTIKKSKSE